MVKEKQAERQIVFVLFACFLQDDAELDGEFPGEDADWTEDFEGVFSTLEKAQNHLPEAMDEELTHDNVRWQVGTPVLRSRGAYRSNVVDGTFYLIRECAVDVGEWTDLVSVILKDDADLQPVSTAE